MMFVRTALIALMAVAVFSTNADAQLFRFNRNLGNTGRYDYSSQPQSAQQASNYNAATYRYTQPAQRVNYVPSQRLVYQVPQQYRCQTNGNQYRVAAAPVAGQELAYRQQLAGVQNQLAQQQYQTRFVTVRDPRTGRTYRQQFLVLVPQQQLQTQQQLAQQPQTVQQPQSYAAKSIPQKPNQLSPATVSQASPIGTASATTQASGELGQTSFDAPILSPQDEPKEVSIFENDGQDASTETGASKSVIESSLPTLDLPDDTSAEPGSLDFDQSDSLDLDLPALNSEDKN